VSRTFQASRVFSALTVFENVKIGAEDHGGIGVVGAILRDSHEARRTRLGPVDAGVARLRWFAKEPT